MKLLPLTSTLLVVVVIALPLALALSTEIGSAEPAPARHASAPSSFEVWVTAGLVEPDILTTD